MLVHTNGKSWREICGITVTSWTDVSVIVYDYGSSRPSMLITLYTRTTKLEVTLPAICLSLIVFGNFNVVCVFASPRCNCVSLFLRTLRKLALTFSNNHEHNPAIDKIQSFYCLLNREQERIQIVSIPMDKHDC